MTDTAFSEEILTDEEYFKEFCREICWDEKDEIIRNLFFAALAEYPTYEITLDEISSWLSDYLRICYEENDILYSISYQRYMNTN